MTNDRTRDERTALFAVGTPDRPRPDFAEIPSAQGLSKDHLLDLWSACLSADRDACHAAVRRALADGFSRTEISDRYIPAVAHQLGEMWCADTLGFAEVTIGTARLQALLRDLGPEWCADQKARADAPLIFLISPRDDQHTLGTVLVAGQMRRRGYSVRMALDPTLHDLRRQIQSLSFDAIFISASQSESLEKLRRMVEFLRNASDEPPPIALGGGVLSEHENVASLTGVEIATNNIDEAIEHCGLTLTQIPSANFAPKG